MRPHRDGGGLRALLATGFALKPVLSGWLAQSSHIGVFFVPQRAGARRNSSMDAALHDSVRYLRSLWGLRMVVYAAFRACGEHLVGVLPLTLVTSTLGNRVIARVLRLRPAGASDDRRPSGARDAGFAGIGNRSDPLP